MVKVFLSDLVINQMRKLLIFPFRCIAVLSPVGNSRQKYVDNLLYAEILK